MKEIDFFIDFSEGELGSYNPYDPSENADTNVFTDGIHRQRFPFTRYAGKRKFSSGVVLAFPLEQGADAFQSGRLLWMDDVESGAQALLRKAGIPATPTVVKMLEKYLEGLVFTDNYEHYLLWSWMRGAWKDEAARNSVIEAYRIVRWVIEGLGLGVQFPKLADIVN